MEMILVAVSAMLAVSAAVAGVRWWTWRPVVKRRVLVATDSEVTFEGVAMSRRGPLLVLGDVTITVAGQSNRADGVVIVERSRVMWMQVA